MKKHIILILSFVFLFCACAVQAAAKRFVPSGELTQFLNNDRTSIEHILGTPVKMTDGSIYKSLPDAVFYYDDDFICRSISAPLNRFFDIQGYSKITSEVLEKNLGVSIYAGGNYGFDWFGFGGYVYDFSHSKDGIRPDSIINAASNSVYRVQKLNFIPK